MIRRWCARWRDRGTLHAEFLSRIARLEQAVEQLEAKLASAQNELFRQSDARAEQEKSK